MTLEKLLDNVKVSEKHEVCSNVESYGEKTEAVSVEELILVLNSRKLSRTVSFAQLYFPMNQ